jgi:hypothetical protein
MLVLYHLYGLGDVLLAAAVLVGQFVAVARWAARFDPRRVLDNYRLVMHLNRLTAAGLTLYLGYHLIGG